MSRSAREIPRNYIGVGGFPLNTFSTGVNSDGSVGTPPPPPPVSGNPWIDPATGEKFPGAPGK